jgi:peptidoglycan-N-acetylmuramic acid deacetylase
MSTGGPTCPETRPVFASVRRPVRWPEKTSKSVSPTIAPRLTRPPVACNELTGRKPLPLFRAPGGKTSTRFLAATRACGYAHVGWAPAGFLGDELPSEKYPNASLLAKALRDVRAGDILVAHLGIWSRKDPWAPAVLEPLIVGLKARGLCFATLREHPDYKAWVASKG